MNSPDQLECAVNENSPHNNHNVAGWLVWLAEEETSSELHSFSYTSNCTACYTLSVFQSTYHWPVIHITVTCISTGWHWIGQCQHNLYHNFLLVCLLSLRPAEAPRCSLTPPLLHFFTSPSYVTLSHHTKTKVILFPPSSTCEWSERITDVFIFLCFATPNHKWDSSLRGLCTVTLTIPQPGSNR